MRSPASRHSFLLPSLICLLAALLLTTSAWVATKAEVDARMREPFGGTFAASLDHVFGPLPPAPETWITGINTAKLEALLLPPDASLKFVSVCEDEFSFGVARSYDSSTGVFHLDMAVYPDRESVNDAMARTLAHRSVGPSPVGNLGDRGLLSDSTVVVQVDNALVWFMVTNTSSSTEEMRRIGEQIEAALQGKDGCVTRGKIIPTPTLSIPSLPAKIQAWQRVLLPVVLTNADPARSLYHIEPRLGYIYPGASPTYLYWAPKQAEDAGPKSAVITIANENNVIGSATLDFEVISEEQPPCSPFIDAVIEYRSGPLPPAPETWITGIDADKLAEIVLPSAVVLKRTDLGEMKRDFGVRRFYTSATGKYGIQIGVYPDQRTAADALTRRIVYREAPVAIGAGFGDRSAISDDMVAVLVANAVIWVQYPRDTGSKEMTAIGQILADEMTKGERFVTRGKIIPTPTLSFPSLTARVQAGTQLSVPVQVTDADPAKFLYKIEPRIGHIIIGNPPVYSYYASKRAEEAGRKSAVITIANENNVIGSATLDFEVIPEQPTK